MSPDYEKHIQGILKQLGIPAGYGNEVGLGLLQEAHDLVSAGRDMFDRPQKMTAETLAHWQLMQKAAAGEGIEILLVSAYRSVTYQKNIFLRKLASGETLEDILKVNVAPGFSEHHTGRALDLAVHGQEPLTLAFENTRAFQWLSHRAADFSFRLSFPENNPYQIDYEPWHWAYTG